MVCHLKNILLLFTDICDMICILEKVNKTMSLLYIWDSLLLVVSVTEGAVCFAFILVESSCIVNEVANNFE